MASGRAVSEKKYFSFIDAFLVCLLMYWTVEAHAAPTEDETMTLPDLPLDPPWVDANEPTPDTERAFRRMREAWEGSSLDPETLDSLLQEAQESFEVRVQEEEGRPLRFRR